MWTIENQKKKKKRGKERRGKEGRKLKGRKWDGRGGREEKTREDKRNLGGPWHFIKVKNDDPLEAHTLVASQRKGPL